MSYLPDQDGVEAGEAAASGLLVVVRGVRAAVRGAHLAVDETVILLHPPLPLVGVSIAMERERQQNDGLEAILARRPTAPKNSLALSPPSRDQRDDMC